MVSSVLSRECRTVPPTTTPPDSPEQTRANPSPPPTSSTEPARSSPSSSQTIEPTPPLEVNQALLDDLPSIQRVDTAQRSPNWPSFNYLAYMSGLNDQYGDAASTLGGVTTGPIQASTEGWNIMGVAWYWWAVTIGGIAGLYYLIKFLINKFFLGVAKTP
ncbi:MAG: hypothetical protein WAO28_03920 [Candidatus Microsaccharimonas sp.]